MRKGPVSALALGILQRGVRTGDELLGRFRVECFRDRATDGDTNFGILILKAALFDGLPDPFDDVGGRQDAGVRKQDGELATAYENKWLGSAREINRKSRDLNQGDAPAMRAS